MGVPGTIADKVKSVADKVAGPVTDVTITGIEKVDDFSYKDPPFCCVDSVYKVSVKCEGQNSFGYYSVRKGYWHLLDESDEAKAATKLKDLLEIPLNIKLTTMGSPQLDQIIGYIAQHPEGLTVSMRTKHDVLPNNLLQKAYQALPK